MKKKIGMLFAVICICFCVLYPGQNVMAASGATSISVSGGNVNIGDTVTVTAKASGASGEKAVATMTVSYDSGVLQFVNCSTTYGGGGSSVTATGDSFTVTLKAVASGSSSISLSASDGVLFDTNEELDSMSGSSASVTVNNAASAGGSAGSTGGTGNTGGTGSAGGAGSTTGSSTTGGTDSSTSTASADNSLKSLTISPGTLSPSFATSTTKYSATVANDVTKIAVTATPSNGKASVESVTGNENLAVGGNTVKIVVKAENGVTATYTINVTRQGEVEKQEEQEEESEEPSTETGTEGIAVDGVSYEISETFSAEDIPTDFTETTVNYHGAEYKGLSFDKGTLVLLYLKEADNKDASGKFFVYDETRDSVYPFVKLTNGEKYVIALLAPVDFVMPDNYLQTSVTVDETTNLVAYQETAEDTEIISDFSVFYGVNHEGSESWYRYDSLEGTYQRYTMETGEEEEEDGTDIAYLQEQYGALSDKYAKEKSFARNMLAILVFVIAILIIVIINLLIHRSKKNDDDFHDDDFDGELDDAKPKVRNKKPEMREKYAGSMINLEAEAKAEPKVEPKAEPKVESKAEPKKESAPKKNDDLEIMDFNDL